MRPRTRRQVIGAALGATAGSLLGRLARPQPGAAADATTLTEQLADDLFVLTTGPTNSVARVGADAVTLVDGTTVAAADRLLAAVADLPGSAPVRTLFNTHWHPEHTGLNVGLGNEGARIIAQENTRLWLTTDITYPWDGRRFEPLAPAGQPNSTFYDSAEPADGISYGYLRHAGHTDGDLYVYFPDADVLAVGDAVYGTGWPFVDWWTGGWIGGIVGTLELVLALSGPDTRIVPARGPVLARGDIEEQFEMYNVIYSRLAELLNRGRGPDEAIAARPTAEFDDRMGGPSEAFVRLAFESLWAYLSPDA